MSDPLPYFAVAEGDIDLPWTRSDVPARRREAPDGILLFDRLLQLAQIDPVLYPPEDHPSLRRLLSTIDDSPAFDTLKKNCLIYYLLKDFSDGREADYAHKRRIPKRFVTSTDAYWLLDHEEYKEGCKKLCAPGVVPDFVSSILRMLSAEGAACDPQYIVNIIRYQKPDLADIEDVKLVLAAYLKTGKLLEAFDLARRTAIEAISAQNAESEANSDTGIIADLTNFILDTCFNSNSPLTTSIDQLLFVPLSPSEDAALVKWLSSALEPTSRLPEENLSLLTEWSTGRLMSQGRFVEAITLLSSSSTSLRRSAHATKRAQDVLADLYSVLPPIQRSLVDVSLSSTSNSSSQASTSKRPTAAPAKIAQVPWHAGPNLPALPVPRSLVEARANRAFLDEFKAGGKPLSREHDLPLSAGGLLRPTTSHNMGVSRSQGKHDERMDVWNAVRQSDSPAKSKSGMSGLIVPGSPYGSGTPSRADSRPPASPFSAFLPTAITSARKPTVQGFGLVRPDRMPVAHLDFSEAMNKYRNKHAVANGQPQKAPSKPREEPKAYDMPVKTPSRCLPPGAFPSSASVSGTTHTLTDDEGTQHSDNGTVSEMGDIQMPGSVRKGHTDQAPPDGVAVNDFAAPPARSTRSRRQSSVPPTQPGASTSGTTTGRKARQRTTSTKDLTGPTPSKKGKTSASSSNVRSSSAAPRRSKRLGSVAPSEPELPMMEMPDADDSVMVEDSMRGKGTTKESTGRTPRRRRP